MQKRSEFRHTTINLRTVLDNQPIPKSVLFDGLPAEWKQGFKEAIRKHIEADRIKIVVLDDDPTGTQTVHGLTVLTEWSVESLAAERKDIVFPGNVGDENALSDTIRQLRPR